MIREQIKKDIAKAVSSIKYQVSSIDIEVTRTSDSKFGDYSTNIALKIGREVKQSPLDFAKVLTDSLQNLPYIKKLQVAEPGFVNFFIKDEVWQNQVEAVLKSAAKFGSNSLGKGKMARVEFVSANPTGPLHFGNARGGPIGDCLCNVLEFSGYRVLREYIDNDRGNQVFELGKTLAVHAGLVKAHEDELIYKGQYTSELAKEVSKKIKSASSLSEEAIINSAGAIGVKIMFEEIIADCKAMGINYDLIVHESDLQKEAPKVLAQLEEKGLLAKKEGAIWFAPKNEFLKDKDAVVVKSDGNYTYFTADVVYHKQKFKSGYDLVVDVFGSNTIGHVPKLKALALALDFDLNKFAVILYQFVRIKRGKEIIKMSKRAGNFVTAREILDEVGKDALRFFILMHDANTHMDFDLELAKEKSAKNPVYYVQYAHARICSILAKADARGPVALHPQPTSSPALHSFLSEKSLSAFAREELTAGARRGAPSRVTPRMTNYQLLTTNYELDLIKQITRLPELVEDITANFQVHRLTSYATDLADSFHKFYEHCPVLTASEPLKLARLDLSKATQIAIANTLNLLGVEAPQKM